MKPIKGYEGLYAISEEGRVANCKTGFFLSGSVNSHGYRVVSLTKDGKKTDCKLHRLLATAFIPNPNNFECVNHIDGDKLNNSLDNLEWCTKRRNNQHAREELSLDFSEKPVVQSTLDDKVIAIWANARVAATFVNGNASCISNCCRGTAASAYDYLWEYAGTTFTRGIREQQKLRIEREIERLSQQLSQLSEL